MPEPIACTVSETDGFRYIARLAPVASPPGTLSFTLSTVWRKARDPHAERRVVQIDLDADALRALAELFGEGLRRVGHAPGADGPAASGEARHG